MLLGIGALLGDSAVIDHVTCASPDWPIRRSNLKKYHKTEWSKYYLSALVNQYIVKQIGGEQLKIITGKYGRYIKVMANSTLLQLISGEERQVVSSVTHNG